MPQPAMQRHTTMPAKWRLGWPYPIGPRVEDPVRIAEFTERIGKLNWGLQDQRASLNSLFVGLSDLAHAEIRYYYSRRVSSRRLSRTFRFLAWLLGTMGLMVPVVRPVLTGTPDILLSWGYIAFALAGAVLVADKRCLLAPKHISGM